MIHASEPWPQNLKPLSSFCHEIWRRWNKLNSKNLRFLHHCTSYELHVLWKCRSVNRLAVIHRLNLWWGWGWCHHLMFGTFGRNEIVYSVTGAWKSWLSHGCFFIGGLDAGTLCEIRLSSNNIHISVEGNSNYSSLLACVVLIDIEQVFNFHLLETVIQTLFHRKLMSLGCIYRETMVNTLVVPLPLRQFIIEIFLDNPGLKRTGFSHINFWDF